MEFEHWRDELEIYKKGCAMGDNDEPIIHIIQNKAQQFTIIIDSNFKAKMGVFDKKATITIEPIK